jgi:predicted DNA-binding ribbon-helix-helix protein
MTKSLHEVIDDRLNEINTMFADAGEWTGEQHCELIKPLHQALLEIAKHGEDITGLNTQTALTQCIDVLKNIPEEHNPETQRNIANITREMETSLNVLQQLNVEACCCGTECNECGCNKKSDLKE